MTEYLDSGTARASLTPSAVENRETIEAGTVGLTLTPAGEDQYAKFLPTLVAYLKTRWRTGANSKWVVNEVEGHWRVAYFGKGSNASS